MCGALSGRLCVVWWSCGGGGTWVDCCLGISIDPSFNSSRLCYLDRGMVFAIAHIRGGGEMGRAWCVGLSGNVHATHGVVYCGCGKHAVDASPRTVVGRRNISSPFLAPVS